jgi:hypothetical protein
LGFLEADVDLAAKAPVPAKRRARANRSELRRAAKAEPARWKRTTMALAICFSVARVFFKAQDAER